MHNLGEIRPGTTVVIPFHTFSSNDPSASVTITGLAVTDIEIYKDSSMTQRASDSGYTLLDTDGIDLDGTTGIHGVSVDLADNTTAGFYAAGAQYTVVVASITIDAAVVNFIPVTFTIGYPNALINTTIATLSTQTSFTLTVGPAENDALNGMWVLIHDVASAVQLGRAVITDYVGSTKTVTLAAGVTFTAVATDNISIMGLAPLQPTVSGTTVDVESGGTVGIDWANVANPTTTLDLSGTDIQLCDTVTTNTDTASTLGTPAADIAADIAAVKVDTTATLVDTADMQPRVVAIEVDTGTTLDGKIDTIDGIVDNILLDTAEIGTAGAGLSDLGGMSTGMKAEVNVEALDVLVTDTHGESSGVLAATSSLKDKITWLATLSRNKITQTATTQLLRNDADSGTIATSTVSDDATTAIRGEYV